MGMGAVTPEPGVGVGVRVVVVVVVVVVGCDCWLPDELGGVPVWVEVDEGAETTAGPLGGVPCAVAVLLTTPASTSAWTMTCAVVAVQVSCAPGAKEALGQVTAPAVGSLTPTAVNVTVPVLVTT